MRRGMFDMFSSITSMDIMECECKITTTVPCNPYFCPTNDKKSNLVQVWREVLKSWACCTIVKDIFQRSSDCDTFWHNLLSVPKNGLYALTNIFHDHQVLRNRWQYVKSRVCCSIWSMLFLSFEIWISLHVGFFAVIPCSFHYKGRCFFLDDS